MVVARRGIRIIRCWGDVLTQIIPKPENLAQLVFLVRGEKVLLGGDLAGLYDVATKVLNQAVKRNLDRFHADFTPARQYFLMLAWLQ